jgi:NHLM bacteriocin system ABC transporter ATP-binding protein
LNAPQIAEQNVEPVVPTGALDLAAIRGPKQLLEAGRLYIADRTPPGGIGARRFWADIPARAIVFPMAATDVAFILASQTIGTRAPRLGDGPVEFDEAAVPALDAWFTPLVTSEVYEPAPFEASLLRAGESKSFGPSDVVTGDAVWALAGMPVLALRTFAATGENKAVACLPMTDKYGVSLTEAATLDGMTTGQLLQRFGAAVLLEVSAIIAGHAAQWHVARSAAEAASRRASEARDAARFGAALNRIRSAISGRSGPAAQEAVTDGDPFLEAVSIVAETEGIALKPPPREAAGSDWRWRLAGLATNSDFRTREVVLSRRWWRESGPSLLGFEKKSGEAVALLGARRGYVRVDPATGAQRRLSAAAAADIDPLAVMFYPGLPPVLDRNSVVQFTIRGSGVDLAFTLAVALTVSLLGFIVPIVTGEIVGVVVPDGRKDMVGSFFAILMAAAIGGAAFQTGQKLLLLRVGLRIGLRLQAAVWDRILRLPQGFFRNYSVGDLALRILGVEAAERMLRSSVISGVLGGLFSITSLGLMFAYSGRLALFAVVYAAACAGLVFVLGRSQLVIQRHVAELQGRTSGIILQVLDGIQKLRVAAAEPRAFALWAQAFAAQRVGDARAGRIANWQTVLMGGLPLVGSGAVFAIAGGSTPAIEVAAFAAFSAAFGQFTSSMISLAGALNASFGAVPLIERLQPIMKASLEVEASRSDPGKLRGGIAVRDLSFRYAADGPWILENIDFTVEPGAFVAIVGPSGSGKSTLLRLLLGFENPTRGSIFYDNKALETLDLRLLRPQIGTVLQNAGLVPGSIRDNIVGAARLDDTEVSAAVAMAGLDADVAAMPMGLETFVAEGGSTLSGGQRQRVMIARAIVRKPALLLFDEATSALDNRTQAVVAASLASLNATRMVIAHRLSTVRDADMILVVESGRIVERGRYADLMAAKGAFFRLVRRQLF